VRLYSDYFARRIGVSIHSYALTYIQNNGLLFFSHMTNDLCGTCD